MLSGTRDDGTPAAQSGFSDLASDRLADHDPTALAGDPLNPRPKDFLRFEHRVDHLQHRPGDGHSPRVGSVFLRHAVIEVPELGRAINRMDRQFDEDPA